MIPCMSHGWRIHCTEKLKGKSSRISLPSSEPLDLPAGLLSLMVRTSGNHDLEDVSLHNHSSSKREDRCLCKFTWVGMRWDKDAKQAQNGAARYPGNPSEVFRPGQDLPSPKSSLLAPVVSWTILIAEDKKIM